MRNPSRAAEEIVPGGATPEDAEEQRRLLYVAVTRAKDQLIVSWSRAVAVLDDLARGEAEALASDGDRGALEVDVGTSEREELALAKPGEFATRAQPAGLSGD